MNEIKNTAIKPPMYGIKFKIAPIIESNNAWWGVLETHKKIVPRE
jgi:hypothetical protein